jgi:type I restriction enzyme M protein
LPWLKRPASRLTIRPPQPPTSLGDEKAARNPARPRQSRWSRCCGTQLAPSAAKKDAAKFKDYLLPLLFLKRLSDVFDDEINRLAEEYGDRTTALEIAESDHALLRFYLPHEARWAILSGREAYEWPNDEQGRSTKAKDIGEHLNQGGSRGCATEPVSVRRDRRRGLCRRAER